MLLNPVEEPKEIISENSFAKGTPSPAASKILSEKEYSNLHLFLVVEEVEELQRTMH